MNKSGRIKIIFALEKYYPKANTVTKIWPNESARTIQNLKYE